MVSSNGQGSSSSSASSSSSNEDVGTDMVIEDILENTEQQEEQEAQPGPSRPKKPKKSSKREGNHMWSELKRLQNELNALKRPPAQNTGENPSIDIDVGPQVRPQVTQLRSSASQSQLRSANQSQLRSAQTPQLSTSASSRTQTVSSAQGLSTSTRTQASSATITSAQGLGNPTHATLPPSSQADRLDTFTIHATDHHDPLQDEIAVAAHEQQLLDVEEDDGDSDEEHNDDDGMFEDLVNSVDIAGDEEIPGEPVPQIWADKINQAWKTKLGRTTHNAMLQKYRIPSNLELKIPQMNNEIWKLCNKWQKKADLNMAASQRTLTKVVTAVLGLQSVFGSNASQMAKQVVFQTTADIVSLLGKVNRELSLKRKISARSVLVGDYKSLATITKDSEENLFGDTLTQDIKDVNIRRKIGEFGNRKRDWRGNRRGGGNYYNRSYSTRDYSNNNNNNSGSSFLWRGRGRNRQDYRASQNQSQRQDNYRGKH